MNRRTQGIELAADLTVFMVLMIGSLVGALVLLSEFPALGFFALIFAFSYMAWQFESFGRVREFRLITGKARPVPSRTTTPVCVATLVRICLSVYAIYRFAPSPYTILVGAVIGVMFFAQQYFGQPSVAMLVDRHEMALGSKRRRKLIEQMESE